MLTILFTLILLGALVLAVVGVVQFFQSRKTDDAQRVKRLRYELVEEKKVSNTAIRALSKISSGSTGNPVLEAQLALDAIEELEMKELL